MPPFDSKEIVNNELYQIIIYILYNNLFHSAVKLNSEIYKSGKESRLKMNRWLYTGDQRWYTHLKANPEGNNGKGKKGLLHYYQLKYLEGKTIICYEDPKEIRYFTVLDTFLHFIFLFNSRPEDDRCFHEVIFGEFPLKLFFDIDVKLNDACATEGGMPGFSEEKMISNLTRAIVAYFLSENVQLRASTDFIWLTSHGQYKRSYHLIIDNYFFFNMDEVNYAIERIKGMLTDETIKCIDWGVYSSKKNLRTLGSYRRGTNRKFIFNEEWQFEGQTVKYEYRPEADLDPEDFETRKIVYQFEASLITNIGHCRPMASRAIVRNYDQVPDCPNEIVERAIDQLAKFVGSDPSELPFQFDTVKGNFILLKRIAPSHCSICKTEERGLEPHEHENSYIRVRETRGEMEFFYDCRRAGKGHAISIGKIQTGGLQFEDGTRMRLEVGNNGNAMAMTQYLKENQALINEKSKELLSKIRAETFSGYGSSKTKFRSMESKSKILDKLQ